MIKNITPKKLNIRMNIKTLDFFISSRMLTGKYFFIMTITEINQQTKIIIKMSFSTQTSNFSRSSSKIKIKGKISKKNLINKFNNLNVSGLRPDTSTILYKVSFNG